MRYTRILYATPSNYKDIDLELLRSLLFVPGNQPRMLEKASQTFPDAFIPDLEDSVAYDDKDEAYSDRNIFQRGCIIKMERINV